MSPDDLLLANSQEGVAYVTVSVELTQLEIGSVAEQPASIEIAALVLCRTAGF
ncbi:hypothetical protein [Steroidobacter sp.]|uniref:hypothetical protein n=1 Tax=Steroidobacter sp. TaxID=1978227 RepID=UPI001A4EB438|nr:hypothetical protein [Steroidobacter sp.]MBL8268019.1 hypothetical protein [Steroidobacter sp.]